MAESNAVDLRALIERLRGEKWHIPPHTPWADAAIARNLMREAAAALEATLAPVAGEDSAALERVSDILRDALSGREGRYRLQPGGYVRWGLVERDIRGAIAARLAAQAREIAELRARAEAAEKDARRFNVLLELWHASTELTLTQDEDGRWSITVTEPVEALPSPGRWTGIDPLAAIDAAIAESKHD